MRTLPNTLSLEDIKAKDPLLGSLLEYLASLRLGEIYLVGGYPRDYFLGEIPSDIDFITSIYPESLATEVASRYEGKSFLLYEEDKSYRVVVDGESEWRTIDFAPIKGLSVEEDLSYRDFTINAMAIDVDRLIEEKSLRLPRDLIDKHYGWRDLYRGILRECHNESFLMDPVRLVRALRFRHLLGMEFEERTLNHMKKYAPLITKVPGERISMELLETLLSPNTSSIFSELESTGLLQYLFPDLTESVGLEQNAYHHLDVWSHTLLTMQELDRLISKPEEVYPDFAVEIQEHMLKTLQDLQPRSSFLRLAALYHDAGKVATSSLDETGRIHFYDHQKQSVEAVLRLSERMRLSRKATDYLRRTVGYHMDIGFALSEKASPRALRKMISHMGDELVDIILMSTADRIATRGPLTTQEGLQRYTGFCGNLLQEYYREKETAPLIGGKDLMDELSLPEGPLIGEVLKEVRIAQLEGAVESRETALQFARDLIRSRNKG